nr:ABC transporter ATP-binding protein/permease [Entomoplasma ellychniae]
MLLVLMLITEYLVNWTIGLFSLKLEIQERQNILIKLVNQDVDFFFETVSGNILTRLVGDTQSLAFGVQQFVTNIIYFLTGCITAISIMLLSNMVTVALFSGIYLFLVIGIAFMLFIKSRRKLILAFDKKRDVDEDMTDRVSNISLIKSSGLEKYEIKRIEDMNEIYNRAGDPSITWSSILNSFISTSISLMSSIYIIAVAIIIVLQNANQAQVAKVSTDIILVNILLSFLLGAVGMLVPTLRSATRAQNAAQRISELTEPVPTIFSNYEEAEIKKIESITLEGIKFAYPKKPDKIILPKTSITFEKGKSYAFVGETGSGKSTIAKLLLKFYEPTEGKIMITGKFDIGEGKTKTESHDLHDMNLPSYLSRVGYVEQEPQIVFGDFWENIRYAKFDATDEEVIRATKKANLHDFIISLKDGYDTILGQRGFLLSGGQKQRLVIARVFLKNPDLLILDEATSALDNIVEKEIQKELDQLMQGRTSVTIAHRLSTIKNVDQIIVLGANGKGILQIGTFEELIEKPGRFKKLYEAGLMG